jgi:hypothetical protein
VQYLMVGDSVGQEARLRAMPADRRRGGQYQGQQPGKPKPPGNPPAEPDDPDEPRPIQEPPPPVPVPPPENPPPPME